MSENQHRNLAIWLLLVCVIIFGMIVLGGVTRLTGSGLSMVEWKPIMGVLPPLNLEQWLSAFDLYKTSPEFVKVNSAFDLQSFKSIFWLEYLHRLLGRFIGFIFFLPMVYFFIRYPLTGALRFKLIGLFLLGGAQGLLGWYMVKSGLVNDPHVSQYRLVAHLSLALFLYALIFWLASDYIVRHWVSRYKTPRLIQILSIVLLLLVSMTMLAGGFVAGTKAGFAFNSFPLMNGHLIPEGYFALTPLWRNLFENIAAVQFNHRLLASGTFLLSMGLCWWVVKSTVSPSVKRLAFWVLGCVAIQYVLGVLTLVKIVPVSLAAMHQAMAVIVLTVVLLLLRGLRKGH